MSKYIIRILYDVPGWCYYHRAVALQKYAPPDFEVSIGPDYGKALKEKPHDLVFQLCYSYSKPLREHCQKGGYKCLIVSGYNVGWGHCNSWLDTTMKYADAVIVNNFEMWDKSGRKPKTYHISNGVDREILHPTVDISQRKQKALWCGSFIHKATKGHQDILIPLQQLLKRRGIELDLKLTNSMTKAKLSLPQMAQWYNTGRYYIVASKNEGTPNPALEAASCGCVVISTKVGNMPELIKHGHNGYLCERTVQELYLHTMRASENVVPMSQNMLKEIAAWDWKIRSQEFYNLFRKLIQERR